MRVDLIAIVAACHVALAASSAAAADTTNTGADDPLAKAHGEVSLRLRSELEVFEDATDRHRVRLRLRLGGRYELTDSIDVGVRLSTGSEDPTSSQLTLGRGFDKQPFKVDRAFVRLRSGDWLMIMGGKLPATFRDRRLIWDEDVAPEGLCEEATVATSDASLSGHATFGQFILVEREDSGRDVFALVAQLGGTLRSGPLTISLDLALHDYPNVTRLVLEHGHGSNTALADGRLASEFRLADGLVELAFNSTAFELGGYVELTHNLRAGQGATALAAGFEATWIDHGLAVGYEYRRVGSDAVLDALAESSWYQQRTGFHGHKLGGKLRLSNDLTIASSIKLMWALAGPEARQVEWLVDLTWAP